MQTTAFSQALADHLSSWGLRRFDSDVAYFQWQRDTIPPSELARLAELAQQKSTSPSDSVAEVAFYDFSVHPTIFSALYSQRYDYYLSIVPLVGARLGSVSNVLDVGCGPGILTTFYAKICPGAQFHGIDRSSAAISLARERVTQLGLTNVQFDCVDLDLVPPSASYELIVATHALLQSEFDPGIPSIHWHTFERATDEAPQADFERRTGVGRRLDHLCAAMAVDGRLIVFEKTRQLARRIPFQRAFAARGYCQIQRPIPVRYTVVEETADDGPFYVLKRAATARQECIEWDEAPESDDTESFDPATLNLSTGKNDEPLYENHTASAQVAWSRLHARQIIQETTRQGLDGKQLHVEIGTAEGLCYLFCANTFDGRQLVVVRPEQADMLQAYYHEIVQ